MLEMIGEPRSQAVDRRASAALFGVGERGGKGAAVQNRVPGQAFADLLQEAQKAPRAKEKERSDAVEKKVEADSPEKDETAAVREKKSEKGRSKEEGVESKDGEDTPQEKVDEESFEPFVQQVIAVLEGEPQVVDGESAEIDASDQLTLDTGRPIWQEALEQLREGKRTDAGDLEGNVEMIDETPPQEFALLQSDEKSESSSLELLNANELMDPDLVIDDAPEQLLGRLQQALGTANAPVLEEMGDTVMPQVIRGLATLVREGTAEMRIQLQPADLGEIELRVRTNEAAVRAQMMVQHPEIKQLVDAQMGRLRAALAGQGLALEGFDVGVDQNPHFSQADDSSQGTPTRSPRVGSVRGGGEDGVAESAPAARAVTGDGAVDYTI